MRSCIEKTHCYMPSHFNIRQIFMKLLLCGRHGAGYRMNPTVLVTQALKQQVQEGKQTLIKQTCTSTGDDELCQVPCKKGAGALTAHSRGTGPSLQVGEVGEKNAEVINSK